MKLQKWNYKTHIYDPYEVPDEWNCPLIVENLDQEINCTGCGKKVVYGLCYTSKTIHTDIGFGYPVCEECYSKEFEEEKKAKN